MRRTSIAVMALAAVAIASSTATAQAKSFAGSWTVIPDPAAAAPQPGRGGGRGLGQAATIAQDDKTLTVTRTTPNGEIKSVYNLDGTESKNTLSMGGNSVDLVSTAKWDGGKLVISTTSNFGGNPSTSTMALSLNAEGNLVVEATAPGRGGGAPTTTTMTYKKG